MRHRTLGRTGITVSEIGFGAWAIGGGWGEQSEKDSMDALHRAIDLGVSFIDTAAGYGDGRSERVIARVLRERKEEVRVATKTPPAPGPWPPTPYCSDEERYSEDYLRANVEERLRNLGTDCLDLLQLHTWTRAWNRNPRPFEVLRRLQSEGKIRHIGLSTPEQDQNSVVGLMRAEQTGRKEAAGCTPGPTDRHASSANNQRGPQSQSTSSHRLSPRSQRRRGMQLHMISICTRVDPGAAS